MTVDLDIIYLARLLVSLQSGFMANFYMSDIKELKLASHLTRMNRDFRKYFIRAM
ncbi:hypothetical protein [Mucilaginibacter sp.]|uniref:hypothetical protein n=1 Tax=Mucilaginibacter sp. TaxID=1882438 RepID=UPI0035BC08E2